MIGISIVGASIMVFEHLKQHPELGRVTGVFDTIPARARYLMDTFEVQGTLYDSLEAAASDRAADAVFIGTPDYAHVDPVCTALAAGKHVYCEKPLALSLEDCDKIVAAADAADGLFYLGKNLRHSPVHEAIHDAIAAGRLGKVLTIEANEHYYGGRTYFRRWNRLRRFGGGLWITKACHDFDLLNWMAGADPVRVYATSALSHYRQRPEGGTHCRRCPVAGDCPDRYDRDPPDERWDQLARLSEEATGVPRDLCLYNSDKDTFDNGIAVIDYANDIRAAYTVNVVSARTTRQMLVSGTEGMIEGDMERGVVTFTPRHGGDPETLDLGSLTAGRHGGADERIMRDFLECCRTGRTPRSGARDGRSSLQLGLAARTSCDTGVPVCVPRSGTLPKG